MESPIERTDTTLDLSREAKRAGKKKQMDCSERQAFIESTMGGYESKERCCLQLDEMWV